MKYVIKITIGTRVSYFAHDQSPSPHGEYDGTTVRISELVENARVYKTRKAAQADIERHALGRSAEVVEVPS